MSQTLLFYSVRIKVILRLFGYVSIALGLAWLVPLTASLFLLEWHVTPYYLILSLFSLGLGWSLSKLPSAEKIQLNEAVAVICFSYLYGSALSAVPLAAAGLAPIDAFFEAVSGITTTGLSMIEEWKDIPRTTYFARAWLQWTGGLGIMLFSLALLLQQGEITKKLSLFQPEADDIIGGSKTHAKGILIIYVLLTLLGTAAMILLGTNFFDSLVLVFASVSTGGFSPFADSLASLSAIKTTVLMFFAFLCAVSLPFYYKLWYHRVSMTQQGMQIFGIMGLSLLLATVLGSSFDSLILAFSSQTTTGFSTFDIGSLESGKKLFLTFSMLIGGGVGSTAGGFKILRLILFFLFLRSMIMRQSQTEHSYFRVKFLKVPVSDKQFEQALVLLCLYAVITALSWAIFVWMGHPPIDSLFEVSSALGTVGLSTGLTGPELPTSLKAVLSLDMLLGRLEIFPWLVFIYPRTWLGQQMEEG